MRVSFGLAIVCTAVVGLALPVAGQAPTNRVTTATMGNPAPAPRLPYTAEFKTKTIQTLASGATITHESTEVVSHDSLGRLMTSVALVPSPEVNAPMTHVNVFDPVARTNSSWTIPGQRATVVAMPVPGAVRSGCTTNATTSLYTSLVRLPNLGAASGISHEKPIMEDLGTQTIQRVEARGRRITSTTPAGAIGNDAPLVRTTETWTATAPGLRSLVARSVIDNPQTGKSTKELTNFTQAEPDASVFQPPEGYEIVNKQAPGSVCPGVEGTDVPMAPIPPPPPAQ